MRKKLDSKEKKDIAVAAAEDKKGRDILTLEIKDVSPITDYFVICGAGSVAQAQAIADNVEEKMRERGESFLHKEGYNRANWILLDYGDVVVHIFQEEDRRFYNLEQLWGDAAAV
jgi:ribosome-associated protein